VREALEAAAAEDEGDLGRQDEVVVRPVWSPCG
jgi:hypothetical protein